MSQTHRLCSRWCSVHSSVRVLQFPSQRRRFSCRWFPQNRQENYTKYHLFGRWFLLLLSYAHNHAVSLCVQRTNTAGKSEHRRSPRIDIFNNSFHYASTVRATACRTSTNCSPENLVVFCQKIYDSLSFSAAFIPIFFIHLLVCIPSLRPDRRLAPFIPAIYAREKFFAFNFIHCFMHVGTQKISHNITRWFSRLCRNCCRQGIKIKHEKYIQNWCFCRCYCSLSNNFCSFL